MPADLPAPLLQLPLGDARLAALVRFLVQPRTLAVICLAASIAFEVVTVL